MLRHVKNPGIVRNILLQSYSDIFKTHHGYFLKNFAETLKTPFLQDTPGRLLPISCNKFVHKINIVSTLYLMSRNVSFVSYDP